MFTVYILYSEKHDKTYTGFTANLAQRFLSHNELSKKGWTVRYRPWAIIYTEQFETKEEAMQREKKLKTGKGRQFIHAIVTAHIRQRRT